MFAFISWWIPSHLSFTCQPASQLVFHRKKEYFLQLLEAKRSSVGLVRGYPINEEYLNNLLIKLFVNFEGLQTRCPVWLA